MDSVSSKFDNIGLFFKRGTVPLLIAIFGLLFLIFGAASGQNSYFLLGGAALMLFGIVSLLISMEKIDRPTAYRILIIAVVPLVALFAWFNYNSIAGKVALEKEADLRRKDVISRLIDIRTAQLGHRSVRGNYAKNFDELISFVANDSFPVVKKFGQVPDTLTEAEAIELKIVTRDTVSFAVIDSLFPENYPLDSIRVIPHSDGKEFTLEAGETQMGRVTVPVFQASAEFKDIYNGLPFKEIAPYLTDETALRVGSMSESSTSGNWGE